MNDRIKRLAAMLEEEPEDPFLHYGLCLEFNKTGDTEKTREAFDKLLAGFPNYLPTYYQAAHFFWEAGELQKAEDVFKTGIALAKEAGNNHALKELQNAYMNFGAED